MMLVLSSPSGAGKSTLARNLLRDREEDGRLTLSVSVTTRARRGSEIDGVDYRFLTARQFEQMRDRGELLEWAQVHGNFYGTPKDTVDQALESGLDVLFDIDWQGARQIREAVPQDVVSIFVLPPSAAELRQRLERRAEDAPEVIANRLTNASTELERWGEYDYVIVNDDLQRAYGGLKAIVVAERLRRERLTGLADFIATLQAGL
ncbi:guanylate kinase [Pseudoxanthobacter sp. M-2]|uniref:guanylate kinase n=1 Tax=Pseudoxanthobacter sp. M-2 TaxID=3078754 RepID=UPI0038FD30C5